VFSEICEHIKFDSTVQQHILLHVREYVDEKPHPEYGFRFSDFYADPKTGLLREYKKEKKVKYVTPVEEIAISKEFSIKVIDGIWYALKWKDLPKPVYKVKEVIRDVVMFPYNHRKRQTVRIPVECKVIVNQNSVKDYSGKWVPIGPLYDEETAWNEFLQSNPLRRYASHKKQLSNKELAQYKVQNQYKEGK
jgi:hypothetical protein